MRRFSKVALVAGAMLAGVLAGGWGLLNRSLPAYEGRYQVGTIGTEIEIVRSENAVPHIFGMSDADSFFGLGYAHAQDRIWQMEICRRTAQGRLSELLGGSTVATDELLLRMGLYESATRSVDVQSAYTQEVLEAYAAGVNARLAQVAGYGAAAPEFLLFPTAIEPWQPADSLAILKLMALQLASQVDKEVLRARVAMVVSPERLADILPDAPQPGFAATVGPRAALPTWMQSGGPAVAQADLHPCAASGNGMSSNAWVAGPERTVSGTPLLANDTHLDFTAPTVWYLARLELDVGTVVGGTIPGVPMVLSGMSPHIAWGLTAANMDDQDVYIERLNPENPDEVLTPDGYAPLVSRPATITVRGGDPVEIVLRWSDNGPIIPGKYYNLDRITPEGHVAAVARTLFDPADTTLTAAHRMLKARDVFEAIAAMETFITPAQNLTLADHDNIAFQMIGTMPRRSPDHTTLGRLPSEGWLDQNRWHGYLPYEANPRYVNPPDGVYGNTNSATIVAPFPYHVSFEWSDTQRIFRLEDLLAGRAQHSREDFMAMQYDAVSHTAQTLVPQLVALLDPGDEDRAEALSLLADWDSAMDADRPEPLIYATWLHTLQIALAGDELGPLAVEFHHPDAVFIDRVLNDVDGAAIWCDDVSTAPVESCRNTVGAALDAALAELTGRYGGDLATLRWGEVHQATHDHQVLGALPVIGRVVNIRQPTSGGDNTLLRGKTRGTGEAPLENIHGALYRAVYDLAAPEASVFVLSTGQSGHPLSPQYRDLGGLWRDGDYIRMLPDDTALRATALGTTVLEPR